MGIDSIGKPPGAGGPGGVGAGSAGKALDKARGDSFDVRPSQAEGIAASDALGALRRGDIDVEQYLDGRVADAVRHLEGKLPADQIDFVKQTLREQLQTDPVLVELVRRTTGMTPSE